MKKTLLILAVILPQLQAHAEPSERERVLKDSTTVIALDLNDKSVFCTDRGYSQVELKISVPDLDWLAHFDHRVVGERLPCMTGGLCKGTNSPGGLVDPANPFELVPVRVILSEHVTIDEDKSTCQRQLVEEIKSVVRGRQFNHIKYGDIEPADFAHCKKLLNF